MNRALGTKEKKKKEIIGVLQKNLAYFFPETYSGHISKVSSGKKIPFCKTVISSAILERVYTYFQNSVINRHFYNQYYITFYFGGSCKH